MTAAQAINLPNTLFITIPFDDNGLMTESCCNGKSLA